VASAAAVGRLHNVSLEASFPTVVRPVWNCWQAHYCGERGILASIVIASAAKQSRADRLQPLEGRVALAGEAQDLAAKMALAWEMPEQQCFGDAGASASSLVVVPANPLRKQRHRRGDDRLAPFVAIQSNYSHCGAQSKRSLTQRLQALS